MAFTIRDAEGKIATIEADYGNAEELKMFLNEVAEVEGAGEYTLAETEAADYAELAAQELMV
jgi:hypothetical protein